MRTRLALMLTALLGLVLLFDRTAGADDPPAPPPEPTVQDHWGWSPGQPGTGTATALSAIEPVQVALPAEIAQRITGDTALLYFSPTCPHCRHAMPELNVLAKQQPDLAFLGIASSRSSQDALDEFVATFGVDFPIVIDTDGRFAWSVGARGTPSLLLARPAPADATPTSGDPVGEDQAVVTVTEAYLPYSRGLAPVIAMRRNALGRTVDGTELAPDAYRDFDGYQGTRACAACHADEAMSWAITHHASAYRTLYLKERADDLACVGCHVVGFTGGTDGSPPAFPDAGGFELKDYSSPLADVGCEACHGPSGPHDGEPAATPAGGGPTDACVLCHDAKHSVAFSVDKGMPHIDHYGASTLTEDELRDRLDALSDGTADRPLLAFPSGPTVGSDSCRDCHKAEHKGWRKFAHASAMETLAAEDPDASTRGECVACHATAVRYGDVGRSSDLADYRTDEGVGCEACHGPGGDHLANPTMDNIVRLGDSCPECVLEGICTSCHDAQWDPGWQLDERLDALPCD